MAEQSTQTPPPPPPPQQPDSSTVLAAEKELEPPSTSEMSDLPAKTEKEVEPVAPVIDSPALDSPALDSPEPKVEKEEASPAEVESRSLSAVMDKEEAPQEPELTEKSVAFAVEAEAVTAADGNENDDDKKKKIPQSLVSFREESNKVSDLSDFELKSLEEFKQLVQEALNNNQFTSSPPPPPPPPSQDVTKTEKTGSDSDASTEIKPPEEPKPEETFPPKEFPVELIPTQVSIWGIPLLEDERSDVILLKFLRARDFKVKDAFTMIKNTIKWRGDFGIDSLVDEDLGDDLDKVVFMHGHDREGHPVCYNVYGEFQNKELYQKTFSDEEKRTKFLRWRVQFLERSIRKLDFSPGGVSTLFQVNDLKNSPGPGKRELRLATKQALQVLQDNYPEFVAKQVFINVPWWYIAFYTMMSPFMTQRTKSKFVFSGPAKSAETLFKYISPEQVPIQYGGLSVDYCDCNPDFSMDDPVTEIIVKPATKQTVEIIIYEKCTIVWEIRVVGWEVTCGAEFAPEAKDAYTIIIQKPTKLTPTDEPVLTQSFKVNELGKILLTVNNSTTKKKKLLYRYIVKPSSE